MTAFGKMLVIINFLLVLAWGALAVITFATRTNWRAASERNAKIADDNYKGASEIKKQDLANTDDSRSGYAAVAAENDRLKAELKQAQEINKNLTKSYEDKLAADRKNDATITAKDATIKTLQDAADLNDKELTKVKADLDAQTRKAKDAEAKMEDAILEARSFKQQAERLTTRIQELADKYSDLVQGGGKSLTGSPPAPENFRGTVRAYKDGFVEITPGLNAGLRPGTVLRIQRLEGGGKFVGYLTIGADVNPDKAVGTWNKPAGLVKPAAADLPKVGDEVVPTK
jgi:hypothetical protein